VSSLALALTCRAIDDDHANCGWSIRNRTTADLGHAVSADQGLADG
jgi:hypothetical protein